MRHVVAGARGARHVGRRRRRRISRKFLGARRPGGRGGNGPMLHNTNYSRPRPEPHTRCSPVAPTPFPPVTACALKFVDNLLAYPKGTIFCCWTSVCRVREMIAFLKYLKHLYPRSAVDSSECLRHRGGRCGSIPDVCPSTIGCSLVCGELCGGQGRRRGGARAGARFGARAGAGSSSAQSTTPAVQMQNESGFCKCDHSASCPSKCVLPLTLAPVMHRFGSPRKRCASSRAEWQNRLCDRRKGSACCVPLDTATGTVPSLRIVFQKASVWKPTSSP